MTLIRKIYCCMILLIEPPGSSYLPRLSPLIHLSRRTSLGSGLGLLLGVVALSESVVGADEAALETDTFRARPLP